MNLSFVLFIDALSQEGHSLSCVNDVKSSTSLLNTSYGYVTAMGVSTTFSYVIWHKLEPGLNISMNSLKKALKIIRPHFPDI